MVLTKNNHFHRWWWKVRQPVKAEVEVLMIQLLLPLAATEVPFQHNFQLPVILKLASVPLVFPRRSWREWGLGHRTYCEPSTKHLSNLLFHIPRPSAVLNQFLHLQAQSCASQWLVLLTVSSRWQKSKKMC